MALFASASFLNPTIDLGGKTTYTSDSPDALVQTAALNQKKCRHCGRRRYPSKNPLKVFATVCDGGDVCLSMAKHDATVEARVAAALEKKTVDMDHVDHVVEKRTNVKKYARTLQRFWRAVLFKKRAAAAAVDRKEKRAVAQRILSAYRRKAALKAKQAHDLLLENTPLLYFVGCGHIVQIPEAWLKKDKESESVAKLSILDYSLSYDHDRSNNYVYTLFGKRVENPLPGQLYKSLRKMKMDKQCIFGDRLREIDAEELTGEKMPGTNFEIVMEYILNYTKTCGKKKIMIVLSTDGKDERFFRYFEKSKKKWEEFGQWCGQNGVTLHVDFIVHELLSLMAVNPATCTQMAAMLRAASVTYYLVPKTVDQHKMCEHYDKSASGAIAFFDKTSMTDVMTALEENMVKKLAKFEMPGTVGSGTYRFVPMGTEVAGGLHVGTSLLPSVVGEVVKELLLHHATTGEYFDFSRFNDYVDQPTRKLIRYYMMNWTGKRISDFTDIQKLVDLLDAMSKTHQSVNVEVPVVATFDFRRVSKRIVVQAPPPSVASLFNFTCLPFERSVEVPVPNSFSELGIREFVAALRAAREASAVADSEGSAFAQMIASLIVPKELLKHGFYLPNKTAVFAWACAVFRATDEAVVFDAVVDAEKGLKSDVLTYWKALVRKDHAAALQYALKFPKATISLDTLLKVRVLSPADLTYLSGFAACFPQRKLKGIVTITPFAEVTVDFGVQPTWTFEQGEDSTKVHLAWNYAGDQPMEVSVPIPACRKDKNKVLSFELPVDVVINKRFAVLVMEAKRVEGEVHASRKEAEKRLLAEMEAAAQEAPKSSVTCSSAVSAKAVSVKLEGKSKAKIKKDEKGYLALPVVSEQDDSMIRALSCKLGLSVDISPFVMLGLVVENRAVEVFGKKERPDLRLDYLLELLRLRWKYASFLDKCVLDELMPHIDRFAACQSEDTDLRFLLANCAKDINPGSWKWPWSVAQTPMVFLPGFYRGKINGKEGFMTLVETYYAEAEKAKEMERHEFDFMMVDSTGEKARRAIKMASEMTRKRTTSPVSGYL